MRNHYLRGYMAEFSRLVAPQWNEAALGRAVKTGVVPGCAIITC